MPAEVPWRMAADGLTLAVRLTPKGGRDVLHGVERLADCACVLKARVRAAPHEGAANAGLQKLLAKMLGVALSRVHVVGGATARIKTLKIGGDGKALARALERSLGETTA
jgi:uncharacterized protein